MILQEQELYFVLNKKIEKEPIFKLIKKVNRYESNGISENNL